MSTSTHSTGLSTGVKVLSISPNDEDYQALGLIFSHTNWTILRVESVADALAYLKSHEVSVVLCARTIRDGVWKDVLKQVRRLEQPPEVVVFAPQADDWLWADVLEQGGYDVLESPFDAPEVYRVVSLAWLRARDLARLHQGTCVNCDAGCRCATG
jgi:DNA-binding NtrC family response regulator